MIARITNFASKENQIIDWYDEVPEVTSSAIEEGRKSRYDAFTDKERLEQLLEQLNILLEEYPDALREENILNKYKTLVEYANSKRIALNNCYSYSNKEKIENGEWNVKGCSYGIRILPNNWDKYNCITITGYNTNETGFIVGKKELKLKLKRDNLLERYNLYYINMSYVDSLKSEFYSGEVLSYLVPKLLTKHL